MIISKLKSCCRVFVEFKKVWCRVFVNTLAIAEIQFSVILPADVRLRGQRNVNHLM